uniref:LRR containing protein n=1 Tax=Parastrongyloides trichosuri TaxID=131310 RepID=A0A0N4Z8G4_PARTI
MECTARIYFHYYVRDPPHIEIDGILSLRRNVYNNGIDTFGTYLYIEIYDKSNKDIIIFPLSNKNLASLNFTSNSLSFGLYVPFLTLKVIPKNTNDLKPYRDIIISLKCEEYNLIKIGDKFVVNNNAELYLKIDNCSLSNSIDCDKLKSLTVTMPYEEFTLNILRKCRNLQELILCGIFPSSKVELPDEFYDIIWSMKNLLYFTFSKNFFMECDVIELILKALPRKICKISFEDNNITKFPDTFFKFFELNELNIGKNNITEIPESLSFCHMLRRIIITTKDTIILFIPECLTRLINVVTIYFGSINKSRDHLNDWDLYENDVNKVCSCSNDDVISLDSLYEISINDLFFSRGFAIPDYSVNMFDNIYPCGSCSLMMKREKHKCFFERVNFAFNDDFSGSSEGNNNHIEIFQRNIRCRSCIAEGR